MRRRVEAERAVLVHKAGRTFRSGDTEVNAVTDIDLAIESGQSVAIVGPSGSGKTTLLNLIGGLDRPSQGEIVIFGQLLTDLSERRLTEFRARHLGFVFQDPHLLPGLSALENVIAARLPWERWRQLEKKARELLTAVGLHSRLDFPPARLSGGERQRVGIARALLGNPRLLLADEPTGNLDGKSTEEVLSLLQRIEKEFGLTLVLATHDPLVTAIAHRTVRLVGGRLVPGSHHHPVADSSSPTDQ